MLFQTSTFNIDATRACSCLFIQQVVPFCICVCNQNCCITNILLSGLSLKLRYLSFQLNYSLYQFQFSGLTLKHRQFSGLKITPIEMVCKTRTPYFPQKESKFKRIKHTWKLINKLCHLSSRCDLCSLLPCKI